MEEQKVLNETKDEKQSEKPELKTSTEKPDLNEKDKTDSLQIQMPKVASSARPPDPPMVDPVIPQLPDVPPDVKTVSKFTSDSQMTTTTMKSAKAPMTFPTPAKEIDKSPESDTSTLTKLTLTTNDTMNVDTVDNVDTKLEKSLTDVKGLPEKKTVESKDLRVNLQTQNQVSLIV